MASLWDLFKNAGKAGVNAAASAANKVASAATSAVQSAANIFKPDSVVQKAISPIAPAAPTSPLDAGFGHGTTTSGATKAVSPSSFVPAPPPKPGSSMSFPLIETKPVSKPAPYVPIVSMKNPVNQPAPSPLPDVVQKHVDLQKQEETNKSIFPPAVKKFAQQIAPDTYEQLHTLKSDTASKFDKVGAAINLPFEAAKELVVQQPAKLVAGLGASVAEGVTGRDQTITPKGTLEKFLLGRAPVQSVGGEFKEDAELVGKVIDEIPSMKALPKNDPSRFMGSVGMGAPLMMFMGGMRALDADVGIGGDAKKVAKGVIESAVREGTKLTARGAAKEVIESAVGRATKEGLQQVAEVAARDAAEGTARKIGKDGIKDVAESATRATVKGPPSLVTRLEPTDREKLLAFTDYVAAGEHKKPTTRNFDLEADVTDILEKNGQKVPKSIQSTSQRAGDLLDMDSRVEIPLNPKDAALREEAKSYPSALAFIEAKKKDPNNTLTSPQLAQVFNFASKEPQVAYGAAVGLEPEFDDKGKFKGFKYNPTNGLIGVAGFSLPKTKLGREVLEKMKAAKQEYLERFLSTTEEGVRALEQYGTQKAAYEEVMRPIEQHIDPKDLANAIKNTPFFKKEGKIPDWAANAAILEKNGRFRLATAEDAVKLKSEGYAVRGAVDSILGENYGQDAGPYLERFLQTFENRPPKDERSFADALLRKTDPNYDQLSTVVGDVRVERLPEGEMFSAEAGPRVHEPSPDEFNAAFEGTAMPEAPTGKERKFIGTVREADITAPEVKAGVQGMYNPITNKETLIKAQNAVAENADAALAKIRSEDLTADNAAIAEVLIKKAQDEGNYEQAIDLVENLAAKATTSGQAIQALSMWGRLTPEGALRYAQRVVDKANVERKITDQARKIRITPDVARDLTNIAGTIQKKKNILEQLDALRGIEDPAGRRAAIDTMLRDLTPEEMKGIFQDALPKLDVLDRKITEATPGTLPNMEGAVQKKFVDMDELDRKVITDEISNLSPEDLKHTIQDSLPGLEARLLDTVAAQVPPTTLRKISTIQTMAQLLNPKTFIRNIIGNAGFAAFENVSDILGAGIDKGLSLITGKRTRMLPDLNAQIKGFARGAKVGFEDAIRGVDTSMIGKGGKHEIGELTFRGQKVLGSSVLGGALSGLERSMGVALKAPDRAFYQAAFEGELTNMMRIAGAAEPTPQMVEFAHLQALRRTFQDDNVISRSLGGLKKLLNGGKEWGAGDLLIKYPKTPGAILDRGIEYSPAGMLRPVFELAGAVSGGKLTGKTFDQRKFVDALARSTVGTAGLVGTGMMLYRLGILTGKPDKQPNIADLEQNQGMGQYKINLSALKRWVMSGFNPNVTKPKAGDVSYSYDWVQPASIGITAGANIQEGRGLGAANTATQLVEGATSVADTLVEQPLFTGLRRFFSAMSYGGSIGQALSSTLKDVPASFVPTFFNQIRQISDNTSRETYDPQVLQEAWNRVKNRIPGVASTLPERSQLVGGKRETYQDSPTGKNSLFNVMFNPGFVQTVKEDPEMQELLRLYEQTGESKQVPDFVNKKQKILGQEFQLSADQFADMSRYVGEQSEKRLKKIIENPAYDKYSDADKVAFISRNMSRIMAEAKAKPFFEQAGVKVPTWFPRTAQALIIEKAGKSKAFKAMPPEKQKVALQKITDALAAKLAQRLKNRSTGAQPGRPVSMAPTTSPQSLGSLSAAFESRGNPGSIGYDATGGLSYGAYQLAHDNAQKFVAQSPYAADFQGIKFNSPAFQAKWKEVAKRDPEGFKQAQHEFINDTHFKPQEEKLASAGIDLSKYSNVLKDVVWSTAVQHGGNTGLVARAFKQVGQGASEDKIIKEIYKQRWGGGAQFASSTPSVKKSVYNRFFGKGGEMATALSRLQEEKTMA